MVKISNSFVSGETHNYVKINLKENIEIPTQILIYTSP